MIDLVVFFNVVLAISILVSNLFIEKRNRDVDAKFENIHIEFQHFYKKIESMKEINKEKNVSEQLTDEEKIKECVNFINEQFKNDATAKDIRIEIDKGGYPGPSRYSFTINRESVF